MEDAATVKSRAPSSGNHSTTTRPWRTGDASRSTSIAPWCRRSWKDSSVVGREEFRREPIDLATQILDQLVTDEQFAIFSRCAAYEYLD